MDRTSKAKSYSNFQADVSSGTGKVVPASAQALRAAEQIPRPYDHAEENARSLNGRFGMTNLAGADRDTGDRKKGLKAKG